MARKAPERGRMNLHDEICIQNNILELEASIEAKDLTGPLFSRNILDMEDMEMIQTGDTRPERARRLLNIIVLRGPKSFQSLVESLQMMGYMDLARKLRGESKPPSDKSATSLPDFTPGPRDLADDVSQLKKRLDAIEHSGVKRDELEVVRKDVKEELSAIVNTLQKIEELSRVSRETVATVDALRKKLVEKDELLEAAKEKIRALETKVVGLERENAKLRYTIDRQQKQITGLTRDMQKNQQKTERKLVAMEIEQRQDRQETQERFDEMEADRKKMMNVIHTLSQQLTETKKDNSPRTKQTVSGLKVKSIIPRHRFQNNRNN